MEDWGIGYRFMEIVEGDCREGLRGMDAGSVRCCVTSPPYWGLRDYGHDGQLGLERTPVEYVERMVEVFREVRRVLADDGTLWLNLGSSYMTAPTGNSPDRPSGFQQKSRAGSSGALAHFGNGMRPSRPRNGAPACGTDGTVLRDWTGADSACSCLCDGCLDDWLSHRDRIAGTSQPTAQSQQPPSLTGRDSEPMDSGEASPGALPLDARESTMLQSWLQRRGACSRCDSRASSLSGLRSSSGDVRPFSRMTWLDYTTRLKQKDMVPTPWLVAFALQADGWWLRSDIIWAKPNPMPESVTDRPTKAHEYLFLLSKSERYHYDAAAIAEAATYAGKVVTLGEKSLSRGQANGAGVEASGNGRLDAVTVAALRNRRSVWTVPTQPFAEAHFAVMPEALVEPCILAGSKPGDIVLDPFAGSGTVGVVALRHGRRFVGCELNPEYVQMARRRIAGPLFAEGRLPGGCAANFARLRNEHSA